MFRTLLIVVALALLGTATLATSATGNRAALTGPFLGSYSAKLTLAEATARGDSRMAGRFTLVLRRNGTYSVSNPLDPTTHGRIEVLGGRKLRFSKDTGCIFGGFERPAGGIYRWSVSGSRLTLRLVSEGPCWGRTQSLTYPVWKRR